MALIILRVLPNSNTLEVMQLRYIKTWDAPHGNANSTRSRAKIDITQGVPRRESQLRNF